MVCHWHRATQYKQFSIWTETQSAHICTVFKRAHHFLCVSSSFSSLLCCVYFHSGGKVSWKLDETSKVKIVDEKKEQKNGRKTVIESKNWTKETEKRRKQKKKKKKKIHYNAVDVWEFYLNSNQQFYFDMCVRSRTHEGALHALNWIEHFVTIFLKLSNSFSGGRFFFTSFWFCFQLCGVICLCVAIE